MAQTGALAPSRGQRGEDTGRKGCGSLKQYFTEIDLSNVVRNPEPEEMLEFAG